MNKGFSIVVDTGRVPQQLATVDDALRIRWWDKFGPRARLLIEREQGRHFSAQAGPNGEAWPPLSPLTLELSAGAAAARIASGEQKTATVRRSGGSQILMDSGLLRRSVTTGGAGSVRRLSRNKLDIGTRVIYAARHQFGGEFPTTPRQRGYLSHLLGRYFGARTIRTPARPFLGFGGARRDIVAAGTALLKKLLRGSS